MAALLVGRHADVTSAVAARVVAASQRRRERRGRLRTETEAAERRADGLDRPEALRLGIEGLGDLAIGRALVVRIGALRVQYLHRALLADSVADLAGIDPDGELRGEILEDVLDRDAALLGGALQDRVDRVTGLQTSERRALERLLRVPVTLELVLEGLLELLAEYVYPTTGQFVVQIRYHEIQGHLHLYVHLGL